MPIWFATVTPPGGKADLCTRFTVQKEPEVENEPFYSIGFFSGQYGSEAAEETNERLMERVHNDMLSAKPHIWNTITSFGFRLRQRWKEKWKRNPAKYSVSGTSATVAVIKGGSLGVFQLGNSVAYHVTTSPNGCATTLTNDHSFHNKSELQRLKGIDQDCTSLQEMTRLSEKYYQRLFKWNTEMFPTAILGQKANEKKNNDTNQPLRYLDCPTRGLGYIFAHSHQHNSQETISIRPHENFFELQKLSDLQYLVIMSPSMAKVVGKNTVQTFFQHHAQPTSDCAVELVKIAVQKFESILMQIEDSNLNKMKPHHQLLEMLSINIEDFSILIIPIADLHSPRSWDNDVVFKTAQVQYGNRLNNGYYGILHAVPTEQFVTEKMVSLKSDNLKIVLNDAILEKMGSGQFPRTKRLWHPAIRMYDYNWKQKLDNEFNDIERMYARISYGQPGPSSNLFGKLRRTCIPAVTSAARQEPYKQHIPVVNKPTINAFTEHKNEQAKEVKAPKESKSHDDNNSKQRSSQKEPNQNTQIQPVETKRQLNHEEYVKRRSTQPETLQKEICVAATEKVKNSVSDKSTKPVEPESNKKANSNANPVPEQSGYKKSSKTHNNMPAAKVTPSAASQPNVAAPSKLVAKEMGQSGKYSQKPVSIIAKEQPTTTKQSSEPPAKLQPTTKKSPESTAKSQPATKHSDEPTKKSQSTKNLKTTKIATAPSPGPSTQHTTSETLNNSRTNKIIATNKVSNCNSKPPETYHNSVEPSIVISLAPGAQPKSYDELKSCDKPKVDEMPSKSSEITDSETSRDNHKTHDSKTNIPSKETMSPQSEQKSDKSKHHDRVSKESPSISPAKESSKSGKATNLQTLMDDLFGDEPKLSSYTKGKEKPKHKKRTSSTSHSTAKRAESKKQKVAKLPMKLDELLIDLFEGDDEVPTKAKKWVDIAKKSDKNKSKNTGGKIVKIHAGKSPKEAKQSVKITIVKDKCQQWRVSDQAKPVITILETGVTDKNCTKSKDSDLDGGKSSQHKTNHSETSSSGSSKSGGGSKEDPKENTAQTKSSSEEKTKEQEKTKTNSITNSDKNGKKYKDSNHDTGKTSQHKTKDSKTKSSGVSSKKEQKDRHDRETNRSQPATSTAKIESSSKEKESSNSNKRRRSSTSKEEEKKKSNIDTSSAQPEVMETESGTSSGSQVKDIPLITITECDNNTQNITPGNGDNNEQASMETNETEEVTVARSKDSRDKHNKKSNHHKNDHRKKSSHHKTKDSGKHSSKSSSKSAGSSRKHEKKTHHSSRSKHHSEKVIAHKKSAPREKERSSHKRKSREAEKPTTKCTTKASPSTTIKLTKTLKIILIDCVKNPESINRAYRDKVQQIPMEVADKDGVKSGRSKKIAMEVSSSVNQEMDAEVFQETSKENTAMDTDVQMEDVQVDQRLEQEMTLETGSTNAVEEEITEPNTKSKPLVAPENDNTETIYLVQSDQEAAPSADCSKHSEPEIPEAIQLITVPEERASGGAASSPVQNGNVELNQKEMHENVDVNQNSNHANLNKSVEDVTSIKKRNSMEISLQSKSKRKDERELKKEARRSKNSTRNTKRSRDHLIKNKKKVEVETDQLCKNKSEKAQGEKILSKASKNSKSKTKSLGGSQTEKMNFTPAVESSRSNLDVVVISDTETGQTQTLPSNNGGSSKLTPSKGKSIKPVPDSLASDKSLPVNTIITDDVIGGTIPIPTPKGSVAATGDDIIEAVPVVTSLEKKKEGNSKSTSKNIHQTLRKLENKNNGTEHEANSANGRLTEILNRLSKNKPNSDMNSNGVDGDVSTSRDGQSPSNSSKEDKATSKRKQSKDIIVKIRRTQKSYNAAESQRLVDDDSNKDVETAIAVDDEKAQSTHSAPPRESSEKRVRLDSPAQDNLSPSRESENDIETPVNDTMSDHPIVDSVSKDQTSTTCPVLDKAALYDTEESMDSSEQEQTNNVVAEKPMDANSTPAYTRTEEIEHSPSDAADIISREENDDPIALESKEMDATESGPCDEPTSDAIQPTESYNNTRSDFIKRIRPSYSTYGISSLTSPGIVQILLSVSTSSTGPSGTALNNNFFPESCIKAFEQIEILNVEINLYWEDFLRQLVLPGFTMEFSDEKLLNFLRDSFTAYLNYNMKSGTVTENARDSSNVVSGCGNNNLNKELQARAAATKSQNDDDLGKTLTTLKNTRKDMHNQKIASPQNNLDLAQTEIRKSESATIAAANQPVVVSLEEAGEKLPSDINSENESNANHPEFSLSQYQPQLSEDESDCDDIDGNNLFSPEIPFSLQSYEPQLSDSESEDETDDDETEPTEIISVHLASLTEVSDNSIETDDTELGRGKCASDSEPKSNNEGREDVCVESHLPNENAILSDNEHPAAINNNAVVSEPDESSENSCNVFVDTSDKSPSASENDSTNERMTNETCMDEYPSKTQDNDSDTEQETFNSSETEAESDNQEGGENSDDAYEPQGESECESDKENAATMNQSVDASEQTETDSGCTSNNYTGISQENASTNTDDSNDVSMDTNIDCNRAEKRKADDIHPDARSSKHLYLSHPFGFYQLPLRREDNLVTSAVQTEPLELEPVEKPVEKPEAVFVIKVNHNPQYDEGYGTQEGNLPFNVQVPLVVPLENQYQTGSVDRCAPKRKRRKVITPKPSLEFSQRHSSHNFQQRMVKDATTRMEDVAGLLSLTDVVAPKPSDSEETTENPNESESKESEQAPATESAKGKSRRKGKKGDKRNKNDTQNSQASATSSAANNADNSRHKRKRGRPSKWEKSQNR